MTKTKIDWATDVWNPTVGCTKVSQGCKNCYAERDYGHWFPDVDFSKVQLRSERLGQPLYLKKPRRIFVDSVSDLFHKDVPYTYIARVFSIMAIAKQHTYMILTKRPERMNSILADDEFQNEVAEQQEIVCGESSWCPDTDFDWPLPNVWLGVSVEDQKTADERIPLLLQTPAILRFVSVEPMLGPVDIAYYLNGCPEQISHQRFITRDMAMDAGDMMLEGQPYDYDGWQQTCPPLDWVICGCESGKNARPMDIEWARNLKNQCHEAHVMFFLKQMMVDGKLVKMPALDGTVWAEYPLDQRINL